MKNRTIALALITGLMAGCGSAAGSLPAGALGVTARDAFIEARSVARGWRADSRLRWIEGQDINAAGTAVRDAGAWFFHFTAPGTDRELLVKITATESLSEERAFSSPPGVVIGDNALGTSWIDSARAMEAAAAAAGGGVSGTARLLLLPSNPPRWVIRDDRDRTWQVHAETGEVVPGP